MPTAHRTYILTITLILHLPLIIAAAEPASLQKLHNQPFELLKKTPAETLKGPQEKKETCYQLKDLYLATVHEPPVVEKSSNKFIALLAALKEAYKNYIKPEFIPHYTLSVDPQHPLLTCFKKRLSSQDISNDIANLRLFNTNENIIKQKVSFFEPFNRFSFFDSTQEYPVWKTKEDPRITPVQKIINKTITDWYICGDRHGDGISIDVMLNYLRNEKLINENGVLAPHVGIIFLGDYIDRGKDSVGVVHRIVQLKAVNPDNIFALRGNHEEGECGNGLQENLIVFGKTLMETLHHWYITAFCNLPQAFFLLVPDKNKNPKLQKFINFVHGGIDSKQLQEELFKENTAKLEAFLSNHSARYEQLIYPHKTKRSTLWADFSINEKEESANLGANRGLSIGRQDTLSYFLRLQKPQSHSVSKMVRGHQQYPEEKFSDTTRIPGVGTYFIKNESLNPHSTESFFVSTLNVAPRTALATAPQYKGKYQLKYDTWMHLHCDWKKGKCSENFLHFDGKTGKLIPADQLVF